MPAKKMTFENSVDRLREIVAELEKGSVSLEESLKLFEEGTKLSSECYEILKGAQLKIDEISETAEKTIEQ